MEGSFESQASQTLHPPLKKETNNPLPRKTRERDVKGKKPRKKELYIHVSKRYRNGVVQKSKLSEFVKRSLWILSFVVVFCVVCCEFVGWWWLSSWT